MKLPPVRVGDRCAPNGVPVRFSLQPSRVGATGHLPAREPWSYLRYWVRANIKGEKQLAAVAFLRQSESFCKAALATSIDAAPLLWYYGFLNLAKAYLCVRNKALVNELESARHGIGEPSDNAEGYVKLSKQKISVWAAKDTNNRIQVFPYLCNALETPLATSSISVIDLLSRVVSIHQAYCTAFKRKALFLRCVNPVFLEKRTSSGKSGKLWARVSVEVPDVARSPSKFSKLKTLLEGGTEFCASRPLEKGVHTFQTGEIQISNPTFSKKLTELKHKLSSAMHPLILPAEYRYYIFAGGAPRVHQAAAIYAIMFYLGSIVRYQPHRFDKLIEKKEQWVLAEFMEMCPKQFVMLLANEITQTDLAYVEAF